MSCMDDSHKRLHMHGVPPKLEFQIKILHNFFQMEH